MSQLHNSESILITGISGYIGSHCALLCAQAGYHVLGIDHKPLPLSLQQHNNIDHAQQDYAHIRTLQKLLSTYRVSTIIHCAASIEVEESVRNPLNFYENNVAKTLTLLKTARNHGIQNIIFSSTCAVYGVPQYLPLDEQHPTNPINPYGKTKLTIEWMLQDFDKAYGLKSIIFRFFNAAGGWAEHGLAERHEPETHLIPRIIAAASSGKPITIFGNDYTTPDGTCVRDYISVGDIARAHMRALDFLKNHSTSRICNLGRSQGASILQVIQQIETILNKKIAYTFAPKRDGDAPLLIANPLQAEQELNWKAQDDLSTIIQQAILCFKQSSN